MRGMARATEPRIEELSRQQRIRRRAYELYVQREQRSGSALDDWLQAEAEIRQAEEKAVDEASKESFPASDPPAY